MAGVFVDGQLLESNKPVVHVKKVTAKYKDEHGRMVEKEMQDWTEYYCNHEEIKVLGAEVMYL